MTTPLEQQLSTQAAQALAAHGFVLVQARLTGSGKYLTLQVLAENPDGSSPGADLLAKASRTLGAQLDVADLIKGRYVLEVSSPGLDRPLMNAADYQRYLGRHAKLSFSAPQPVGNQSLGAVSGHITAVDDTSATTLITLAVRDTREHCTFALNDIRHAELNTSPEELALFMKRQPLPGDVLPAQFTAPADAALNA